MVVMVMANLLFYIIVLLCDISKEEKQSLTQIWVLVDGNVCVVKVGALLWCRDNSYCYSSDVLLSKDRIRVIIHYLQCIVNMVILFSIYLLDQFYLLISNMPRCSWKSLIIFWNAERPLFRQGIRLEDRKYNDASRWKGLRMYGLPYIGTLFKELLSNYYVKSLMMSPVHITGSLCSFEDKLENKRLDIWFCPSSIVS